MNQKIKNKKIAVIGAGLSGVVIAKELSKFNQVTVFEKSRGIGGRMATRRVDDFQFDHGAQFFTANSIEFQKFCDSALKDKVIAKWQCNVAEIIDNKVDVTFEDNKTRYVSQPQMNSLCKYIGKDLSILLNQQIENINYCDNKWSLQNAENEIYGDFDYLILAIPSPQTVNLIPSNFNYLSQINNIKMSGCFTLMLGFKKDLNINFDAASVRNSNISWIAKNHSKPGRKTTFSLVIHSDNKWADDNIEKDLEVIKKGMMTSLGKIISFSQKDIDYQKVHRWKYANSEFRQDQKSLFDSNLKLGICGDYFISAKVENAFISSMDLLKKINE